MCSWRGWLLRSPAFQRSALVLWDLRWGQDEDSVTDRGRLLFADAGFQYVNVVTGGIAEVYALHALLIAIFLMLCYHWVQHPASDRLMLSIFFILALSFSNHHLTMTLAPLPYLLILLLRRRAFFDWFFAGMLTVLLGYLAFAILSRIPQSCAQRFASFIVSPYPSERLSGCGADAFVGD